MQVWQSTVPWQLGKLCWWRPCATVESSRMWTLCGDMFHQFSCAPTKEEKDQRKRPRFPKLSPISATKSQIGPLKDRSTIIRLCCCCCSWIYADISLYTHSTHARTQQRKRPHSEYKSWQFGNWAFGLMEPPRQHPEPDDRGRDLNKRAEYWGEQRCQGNITVKM